MSDSSKIVKKKILRKPRKPRKPKKPLTEKQKQKQKQSINIKIGNVTTKSDGKSDKQQAPLIISSNQPSYIPPQIIQQPYTPQTQNPYNMQDIKELIDSKFSEIFKPSAPQTEHAPPSSETQSELSEMEYPNFTNPKENIQSNFTSNSAFKHSEGPYSRVVTIFDSGLSESAKGDIKPEEQPSYIPFSGSSKILGESTENDMRNRWVSLGEKLEAEVQIKKEQKRKLEMEKQQKQQKELEAYKIEQQKQEENFRIAQEKAQKIREENERKLMQLEEDRFRANDYIIDFLNNSNTNDITKEEKKKINKNLILLGLEPLASVKSRQKAREMINKKIK